MLITNRILSHFNLRLIICWGIYPGGWHTLAILRRRTWIIKLLHQGGAGNKHGRTIWFGWRCRGNANQTRYAPTVGVTKNGNNTPLPWDSSWKSIVLGLGV